MKRKPARGTAAKHAGTSKHAGSGKHHPVRHKAAAKGTAKSAGGSGAPVHTVAKHPSHPKPRTLAVTGVGCCPAEAVAAAARLAGWAVTGSDVLDLYARCADGPSSGFTIAAALTAAGRFGVTEFCPLSLEAVREQYQDHRDCADSEAESNIGLGAHALILGVDLPGPHAVTVAPDGCWITWGEHHDPAEWPDAVIEEAWAVSFA